MTGRADCFSLAWGLLLWMVAPSISAADEGGPLEVWLLVPQDSSTEALRAAVEDDLARTPRRHTLRFETQRTVAESDDMQSVLAVAELVVEAATVPPRLAPARAGDEVTPGWLVHAVLRAAASIEVDVRVADRRSSWTGQLVERSTRRGAPGGADEALALGVPAVRIVLPTLNADQGALLAAIVRRLDGLDGYPLFEDEYLVLGGHVLLRRDLYWLGLVLWLLLYWRGRSRSGQQFLRWPLLAAWLVTPVFATVLLALPAVVAVWRPTMRWPANAALAPTALFGARLAWAIVAGSRPAVSILPALLVVLALAAFVRLHLWSVPGRGGIEADAGETGPSVA